MQTAPLAAYDVVSNHLKNRAGTPRMGARCRAGRRGIGPSTHGAQTATSGQPPFPFATTSRRVGSAQCVGLHGRAIVSSRRFPQSDERMHLVQAGAQIGESHLHLLQNAGPRLARGLNADVIVAEQLLLLVDRVSANTDRLAVDLDVGELPAA